MDSLLHAIVPDNELACSLARSSSLATTTRSRSLPCRSLFSTKLVAAMPNPLMAMFCSVACRAGAPSPPAAPGQGGWGGSFGTAETEIAS